MAKEIKLTKRAQQKLVKIAEYLEEEFGVSVAQTFSARIIDFFEVLSNYPSLGTLVDNKKDVYGFVLSKQITVFYRAKEAEIIVLNLFDNRMNPKKSKY